MGLGSVTLGASAKPLSTSAIYCAWITIFNLSSSNNAYVGDSSVTNLNGLALTPSGSLTASVPIQGTILSSIYVAGTSGQKVGFLYETAP